MCEHSEYFGDKHCEKVVPAIIANPRETLSTYRKQGLLATLNTVPDFDDLFANSAVCEQLIRQVSIAQRSDNSASLKGLLAKAEAGSVKTPTLRSQPTRLNLVIATTQEHREAVRVSLASVRRMPVERQLVSVTA